jgi:hypothetical protein
MINDSRIRKSFKEYLSRFVISIDINVRLASLWIIEKIKLALSGFSALLYRQSHKLCEKL